MQIDWMDRVNRQEVLAMVGYLTLCNAFGDVCDLDLKTDDLPLRAKRIIGSIMAATGRPAVIRNAPRQDVIVNRRRRVRVRTA